MRPKVEVPVRILRDAVAHGRSLPEIQRDLASLGVTLSTTSIRDRMLEAGLPRLPVGKRPGRPREPRKPRRLERREIPHPPRIVGVPMELDRGELLSRSSEVPRLDAQNLAERAARDALLALAQTGDVEALTRLWREQRLRLPLIEARLTRQGTILPWTTGGDNDARPNQPARDCKRHEVGAWYPSQG